MLLNVGLMCLYIVCCCSTRDGRFSTRHQEFVQKYNLGNPEYGNFFLAQYDDYVPILNDLLKSYAESAK